MNLDCPTTIYGKVSAELTGLQQNKKADMNALQNAIISSEKKVLLGKGFSIGPFYNIGIAQF